jgi:hypothetical protein
MFSKRESKPDFLSVLPKDGDGDLPADEKAESRDNMKIADRVTNPAVVISTLCRRMLDNQKIDDVIRYNLEVILEESEKIKEVSREIRTLSACRDSRSGGESREVDEG